MDEAGKYFTLAAQRSKRTSTWKLLVGETKRSNDSRQWRNGRKQPNNQYLRIAVQQITKSNNRQYRQSGQNRPTLGGSVCREQKGKANDDSNAAGRDGRRQPAIQNSGSE